MKEQMEGIEQIAKAAPGRIIISKPSDKQASYRKIVVEKKESYYQAAAYTKEQVFHENIQTEALGKYLADTICGHYLQVNARDDKREYMLLISKKGKVTFQTKRVAEPGDKSRNVSGHNRKKNYILDEGNVIAPLVDMGIFTAEGKVVKSMYDKFRQINRFLEVVDDGMRSDTKECLNIIDFGCGKSYLTFILYYYFTEIKKREVQIVGLDLKEDVIQNCNAAAEKYGYRNLHFEIGDIGGYQASFPVDIVVTLHACDTATDYALFHAICWNARMIFSVPCCQHELNRQIQTQNCALMTRYGIVKERFCALATDAIRANLLEYCGYKTQLLEFIDFAHTPKNILIRAVQKGSVQESRKDAQRKEIVPLSVRKNYLREVEQMMAEFHFEPALYRLLQEAGRL